ncbi:Di-copper centre-containing protein [Corynespora cassiicola Philippines]|uniref:Di-copper centre-containing protein n=1 Tax=Corynespora cassiicola Philippines TaxID=1448308 RepID=A0A2T2N968_CORCC|nr:Di-copper centre-containing protein [Corynespora cassiicola Philippines]
MRLHRSVALFPLVLGLPLTGNAESTDDLATRQNLITRKEWRSLSAEEKRSYLNAVQCLLDAPPVTSTDILPGVQNHFEDFLGTHILQANDMHYVAEIRACGFEGGQPYWDWTLDGNSTDDFLNSEIFDPETGFGGNGEFVPGTVENPSPDIPTTMEGVPLDVSDRSGGGCIPNGPFANMTIHMGPGESTSFYEWCVRRDFVPSIFLEATSQEALEAAMSHPDFGFFSQGTEISNHAAGHLGVGGLYGTLTDVWASPGDPLFFLHHANMDRLWWSWQSRNLSERLTDISGPVVPQDWTNESGRNVTLDDLVHVGTTENITMSIRDLMDIQSPGLGYSYDSLY